MPADRARLAAEALAQAKADARGRGDLPAGFGRQPGNTDDAERSGLFAPGQDDSPGPGSPSPRGGGTGSGAPARGRPRREDPQPLLSAIGGLLDTRGWQRQAAMGSVFGRWAEIVGQDLAAHTHPESFADGELAVTADSTAWATQVRLLASVLVRRLNDELGDGSVRRVKVRGPAPPRQRGGWRVPGSKGPGDTYG
ncbi:MAG TPA: DciA family protein [Streptosporangiaceae bacterium]|nr:DciA family protein [Streptosporangiaceae bacterium]